MSSSLTFSDFFHFISIDYFSFFENQSLVFFVLIFEQQKFCFTGLGRKYATFSAKCQNFYLNYYFWFSSLFHMKMKILMKCEFSKIFKKDMFWLWLFGTTISLALSCDFSFRFSFSKHFTNFSIFRIYRKTLDISKTPKMANNERTFIAVKPDGVQRGLVGKITQRFEERGYKLVGIKMVHASKDHLEVHYQDLKVGSFLKQKSKNCLLKNISKNYFSEKI